MGKHHRCYYCGSVTYGHGCPTCKKISELGGIKEKAKEGTLLLEDIKGELSDLSENFKIGIGEIRSVLEWGFESVLVQSRKQSSLLEGILYAATKPYEVEANNLREIGEELRKRGILDKAEKRFIDSLEKCELDYRTYIGLADVYIQNDDFDRARDVLMESIPHAPKHNGLDFASLSWRTIGRTYFAQDNMEEAVKALENAIRLSPDYLEARNEFVQYCALLPECPPEKVEKIKASVMKLASSGPQQFLELQEDENLRGNLQFNVLYSLVDWIGEKCRTQTGDFYSDLTFMIRRRGLDGGVEGLILINHLMRTHPKLFYESENTSADYQSATFEMVRSAAQVFENVQSDDRNLIDKIIQTKARELITANPEYHAQFTASSWEFHSFSDSVWNVLDDTYAQAREIARSSMAEVSAEYKKFKVGYDVEDDKEARMYTAELWDKRIARLNDVSSTMREGETMWSETNKIMLEGIARGSYVDLLRVPGEMRKALKIMKEANRMLERMPEEERQDLLKQRERRKEFVLNFIGYSILLLPAPAIGATAGYYLSHGNIGGLIAGGVAGFICYPILPIWWDSRI